MKNLLIIVFLCAFIPLMGQKKSFKDNFNSARNFLLEGETEKALPILQDLYQDNASNANINYLLGVCYTEEDSISTNSIYHLENARKSISKDYIPNTHKEKNAPIFVYYFLSIAYSQNHSCMKAYQSSQKFSQLYGQHKRDFYVLDAQEWVDKCFAINPEQKEALQSAKDKKPEGPSMVTKTINYTTASAIYGIQLGAYNKVVPVYTFNNIKNVEAFKDKNGMIRYVVGHFTFRNAAEKLLEVVKEAGYNDAFIVDVNKEKAYETEIVIVNNESIKKDHHINEKIDYSVQIGAFRDSIPLELAQKYIQLDAINEHHYDDLTILTSGNFDTYENAAAYKLKLSKMGIPGVFVVAFKDGEKIAIKKKTK